MTLPCLDLAPAGGTPIDRWLSCCFPKKKPDHNGPHRKLVTDFKHELATTPKLPKSSIVKERELPRVTEETQSGILREFSDADIPTLQDEGSSSEYNDAHQDLIVAEAPASADVDAADGNKNNTNKKHQSLVQELWRMVFSVLFMTWMGNAKQPAKLKQDSSSKFVSSNKANLDWINE